jgi:ribosomal protein L7/L12
MTTSQIPLATARFIQFVELIGEFVKNPYRMMTLANSLVDLTNEIVRDAVDDALDSASHPFRSIEQQEQELQATYRALHAAEQREDDLLAEKRAEAPLADWERELLNPHEYYVDKALADHVVIAFLMGNRKIDAIIRLKDALGGIGLREAKNAVEDSRVIAVADAARAAMAAQRDHGYRVSIG